MASGTGYSKTNEELKLRGIGTFWFLDIGGKLKRLAILDNAQNVSLVNNVIFAGNKIYQVFTSEDSAIVVSEIEDVRATTNTAQKKKENNTVPYNDRSDNGENSGSAENDPNNAETNDEIDDVVNACRYSSYDTETSFDRKGDGESVRSAENVPNNVLSSSDDTNVYAFVTKPDREGGSISDSDEDDDLEKGHEEYIAKKGKLRGIFEYIKKAVKRNTDKKQLKTLYKKEESIYDNEKEIASPSISSEIYQDVLHIRTNINEVPGPTLVTALYDFKAFLDDEISFEQSDRFKLYEEGKSSDSDWCLAEHLKTGKKGYIPRAFVTNDMSSLEIKEWWFNVERYAAEQLLFSGSFRPGTFLVRPSNGMPMQANTCVLSVLCGDLSKGFRVAHYQIRQHLGRVYISRRRTFTYISELVDFYKATAAGLACKLRRPVPKHLPIIYPRQMEVKRKCLGQLVPFKYGNYLKLLSGKFFDIQDVTVARISTGKMTLDEFREAATLLYNCRDSKAKIVRMIAVCFDPVSHLIVLGETIYCTLKEYLKKKGRNTHRFSVLIQYAAQVADGMAFLERNNIVHGCLRADCAFVCYPYVVKIAHPKLNELISGSARNIKWQGDWKWTALEAINDERNYSVKSDVWSYGVLLYELITLGEEPYNGLTAEEALSLLEKGVRPQRPYDSPDRCPIAFYVTMLKCWHKHPECRPSFDFLRELFLDFENIEPFEIGLKGSHRDSQSTNIQPTERNGKIKTFEQATNKSEDKQARRGLCVKALYSFEADDDDEISLNENDVITDVDLIDEGWWIGTAPGGKRGMFPSNYVEMLSSEDDGDEIFLNKDDVKTDVDPSEVDPYDEGTTPDGKRDIIPSNNGGMLEDALTVRALYDFDATNDDDLSFRKGDKLEVDEEARKVSNWWVAKHLKTGAKGYVPSNYVTKDDNFLQAQELEILQDCDLSVTASGNKNAEYELN